MIIKRKRFDHMQYLIRKQSDSIYVFAKEREGLLNELLIAEEREDRLSEQLTEAQKKIAAAESRNGVMLKAVKGLKELLDEKGRELAELREQNRELNRILDRVAASGNGTLIEAAYAVVDT